MKHLFKGLLFGLGLLPALIFATWLFHNWPLWEMNGSEVEELFFDRSQLHVGEVKLSLEENGWRALGEIENRSDNPCGFLQLDCDLIYEGKVIAHDIAVLCNLVPRSLRGYSLVYDGVPKGLDPNQLKVQVTIAQAFNVDPE